MLYFKVCKIGCIYGSVQESHLFIIRAFSAGAMLTSKPSSSSSTPSSSSRTVLTCRCTLACAAEILVLNDVCMCVYVCVYVYVCVCVSDKSQGYDMSRHAYTPRSNGRIEIIRHQLVLNHTLRFFVFCIKLFCHFHTTILHPCLQGNGTRLVGGDHTTCPQFVPIESFEKFTFANF